MKSVEFVLLPGLTGAMTWELAVMMWPVASKLGAAFMTVAQALQLHP